MDYFEAYKELRKMLASYDDMVNLDRWTYRKYEKAVEMLLQEGSHGMRLNMRADEVNE